VTEAHALPEAGCTPEVDLGPYLCPEPVVLVVSGPSGAGKDATIRRMMDMGHPFHFVVTATTRPARAGEVNGVDYWFLSREEFERMIAENELVEHALVYGEHKGIPKAQIRDALASGQDVVLRVDVQGARRLRELLPGTVSVFLTTPCEAELVARLRARHTETEDALQRRLTTARAEMQELASFDYVVVNRDGDLDGAVHQILAIVQTEKCRTRRKKVVL
jgi:guanylate kinase